MCELLDIFFEGAVWSGCAVLCALVLQWGAPVLTLSTEKEQKTWPAVTQRPGALGTYWLCALQSWQDYKEQRMCRVEISACEQEQNWGCERCPLPARAPGGSHTHTVLSVCLTAPAFWNDTYSDTESVVLAEFHTPGSCQSPNLPSSS